LGAAEGAGDRARGTPSGVFPSRATAAGFPEQRALAALSGRVTRSSGDHRSPPVSTWRFRHPDARPGASRVRKATHRRRWFVNAMRTTPTRATSKGTVWERRGFEVHEGRPAHSREGGDSAPVVRGIPSGGSASEGGARKGIEDEGRPRGPIGPAARAVDTDKGRGGFGRTGQRPAAPRD